MAAPCLYIYVMVGLQNACTLFAVHILLSSDDGRNIITGIVQFRHPERALSDL